MRDLLRILIFDPSLGSFAQYFGNRVTRGRSRMKIRSAPHSHLFPVSCIKISVARNLAWIFCIILWKLRDSESVTYENTLRSPLALVSCVLHQNLRRESLAWIFCAIRQIDRDSDSVMYVNTLPTSSPSNLSLASKSPSRGTSLESIA